MIARGTGIAALASMMPVLGLGCGIASSPATDASLDVAPDAQSPIGPTREVDVLFVIADEMNGDSTSVAAAMADASSQLFYDDLFHWDTDGDGNPDFPPPTSVHVGVISPDMGVGTVTDAGRGCEPGYGYDGLLFGVPGGPLHVPECMPPADGVFVLPDPGASFGNCMGGIGGCIHPQLLDAALKALSPPPDDSGQSSVPWTAPGYTPPLFLDGTVGHGGPDGPDGAFLRSDSVLVVVVATMADDCSTPTPEIFSVSATEYGPPAGRCRLADDHRYPIARYIEGFLGLRRDPSRVVYAVMAGMPENGGSATPEMLLADPLMQEVPDPMFPGEILPACSTTRGRGYPARRLVSVAAGIERAGGHVVLGPSCWADADARLFEQRLVVAIGAAMAGTVGS